MGSLLISTETETEQLSNLLEGPRQVSGGARKGTQVCGILEPPKSHRPPSLQSPVQSSQDEIEASVPVPRSALGPDPQKVKAFCTETTFKYGFGKISGASHFCLVSAVPSVVLLPTPSDQLAPS